jgi:hypothetical protein
VKASADLYQKNSQTNGDQQGSTTMSHDLEITGAASNASSDKLELFKKRMREARVKIYRDAEQWQESAVAFGETISEAKDYFPHGAFGPWCRSELGLSESQRAAYLRLYKARADLDQAREWARKTGHKYADALSVDRLLRIVEEWRTATGRKPPPKRRARSAVQAIAVKSESPANEPPGVIALSESLPPHIVEAGENIAAAIVDYESASGWDILGLVLDFIADAVKSRASQTCGRPQLSGPPEPKNHGEEHDENAETMARETPLQRLRRAQESRARQSSSDGKPISGPSNSSAGL